MLLLFPGFPPHFAMGYMQDYKVNALKGSRFGVGRRDYNCIATRTFEYDGQLEAFFSVLPWAALQPAQNAKRQKEVEFYPSIAMKQLFVSFLFPGAIPKGAVGQPGTNNKLPFALCIPRWELAPSYGSRGSFPRRTGAARHWWTSRCAGSFSSRCSGFSLQWATSFPGTLTVSSCWYIPFWWSLVH